MNNQAAGLTVLVPVFNYDIENLLEKLILEKKLLPENGVRIIFLDDCSTDKEASDKNKHLVSSLGDREVRYFVARKNGGRSKTRNKLIRLAKTDWILFLDADVLPDRQNFLRHYLETARTAGYDVICGGTSYEQRLLPDPKFDFYFDLMKMASNVTTETKNIEKWRYVLTSNIFAKRAVFQACKFDERFKTYGYEDQEWAIRVARCYSLIHVDNPVSHIGLQTREEFFKKMRVSIPNYWLLGRIHPDVFNVTPLARLVYLLSFFPALILKCIAGFSEFFCINLSLPVRAVYWLYQLEKVTLLSVVSKMEKSRKN